MKTKRTRASFLAVISIALLISFTACNSLVQSKKPTIKGSGGERSVASELKVTGIKYQVGDYDPDTEFSAYPDSPADVYYTHTLASDVYWYTIQLIVEGDIGSVLYEVQDMIQKTFSEKLTTQGGFMSIDLSVVTEVNVYIYAGKKTYTVHLQKQNPEACIYVSAWGNGKNTDEEDANGQRGYTPATAYYSLHKAVSKMKTVGFSTVAVIGTLTSDQYTDDSSAFILDEDVPGRSFSIRGFQKPYYNELPMLTVSGSSNKRILTIAADVDVTIVGLTFSGAKTKEDGAAIYLKSVNGKTPRVTLRGVTVTNNTTTGNGGGIYTGDDSQLTLSTGTKVYGNKVAGNGRGSGVYHKGAYFAMEGLSYIGTGAPEHTVIESIDEVADTLYLAAVNASEVHPVSVSPKVLPRSDNNDPGIAAFIEVPSSLFTDGTVVLIDEQSGGAHGLDAGNSALKNYMRFKMIGAPVTSKLWRIDAAGKLAGATAYYVGAAAAGIASDANDGLSGGTPFLTLEQALYSAAATSVCRKVVVQSRLDAANHNAVLTGPDSVYLHLVRSANTGAGGATFNIRFDPKQTEATAIKIAGLNTNTTESDIVSSVSLDTRDVYFEFEGIKIVDSTFSGGSVLTGSAIGAPPVWFANAALRDTTSVDGTVYGDIHIDHAAAAVKTLDGFVIKAAASGVLSVQGVTVSAGFYDFRGSAVRVTVNGSDAFVTNKEARRSICSELHIDKGVFEMAQSMEGRIYKNRLGDLTWSNKDAMLSGNALGDGMLYFEAPVQVLDSGSNVMEPTAYEVWRAAYMSANSGAEPKTTHKWYGGTNSEKPVKLDFTGTPEVKLVRGVVLIGARYARGAKVFTGSGATEAVFKPVYFENYRDGDAYDWVLGTGSGNLGVLGRQFVYGDLLFNEPTMSIGKYPGDLRGNVNRTSFVYKVNGGDVYKVMFWGYLSDFDEPKDKHKPSSDTDKNPFGMSYGPTGTKGKINDGYWRLPSEEDDTDQEIVNVWSDLKREFNMDGGKIDNQEAFFVTAGLGRTFTTILSASLSAVLVVATVIAVLLVQFFGPGGAAFACAILGVVAGGAVLTGALNAVLWLVVDKMFDYDFMRLVSPSNFTADETDENYKYTALPEKGTTLLINSFSNFVEFEHDPAYRAQ